MPPRKSRNPPPYETVAPASHGFDTVDEIDSENDVPPGAHPALTERRPRNQASQRRPIKNPEEEDIREREYEETRPERSRKGHDRGSYRHRYRDEVREEEKDIQEPSRKPSKGKGRDSGRSRQRDDSRGRDDRYDDDDRYGASRRDRGNRARNRSESRSRSRSQSRDRNRRRRPSRSRSRSRSRDRYSKALTRHGRDDSKALSRRRDRSRDRSRSRERTKRSHGGRRRRSDSEDDGDDEVIKTQRYVAMDYEELARTDIRIICKQLECTANKVRGYCERSLIRTDRQTNQLDFRKLSKIVGEDDAARLKKLVDKNNQRKQDELFSGAGPSRPQPSIRDHFRPPPPVVYEVPVLVHHPHRPNMVPVPDYDSRDFRGKCPLKHYRGIHCPNHCTEDEFEDGPDDLSEESW